MRPAFVSAPLYNAFRGGVCARSPWRIAARMASDSVKHNHVIVYTTTPNSQMATKIAAELVKGHSAACVQQVPGMKATYFWQGEVHHDEEMLLLIKTHAEKVDEVKKKVAELHPYDTPELVVTPIVDGSEKYLKWIDESTVNALKKK